MVPVTSMVFPRYPVSPADATKGFGLEWWILNTTCQHRLAICFEVKSKWVHDAQLACS